MREKNYKVVRKPIDQKHPEMKKHEFHMESKKSVGNLKE